MLGYLCGKRFGLKRARVNTKEGNRVGAAPTVPPTPPPCYHTAFRTRRKFEIKKCFILVMSDIQDESSRRTFSVNKTNSLLCLWFIDKVAIMHSMW